MNRKWIDLKEERLCKIIEEWINHFPDNSVKVVGYEPDKFGGKGVSFQFEGELPEIGDPEVTLN